MDGRGSINTTLRAGTPALVRVRIDVVPGDVGIRMGAIHPPTRYPTAIRSPPRPEYVVLMITQVGDQPVLCATSRLLRYPPDPLNMNTRTLIWASAILALAVAFGAFGAHGIEARVDIRAYHNWQTAAQYQFYHGLALLGLAALEGKLATRIVSLVRIFFVLGVLCFSGSLYLLATREMLGTDFLTRVLGPITPLGGLLFIAGWVVLLVGALHGLKRPGH